MILFERKSSLIHEGIIWISNTGIYITISVTKIGNEGCITERDK